MAPRRRRPGQILPFRIPFFRIFYSTTYTILYAITLAILAITPVSMVWAAIEQNAYQYSFMISGTYVLVLLIAIFIYSSRLYTNRTVLAGVGKAYIPIEAGEVGKKARKMIVKQLERSAIIAWESRPRDLLGEILRAEQNGFLPPETASLGRNDYTVGREIPLDPANPPWGVIEHDGWSSPAEHDGSKMPDLQFATVIAELPNLVEAKAVSLAPADPSIGRDLRGGPAVADMAVVEALRRPATTSLRGYLVQLAQLDLINPPHIAQSFLSQYEHARFSGLPTSEADFHALLATFSELLAGMTELDPVLIARLRDDAEVDASSVLENDNNDDDSIAGPPLLSIEVPPPLLVEDFRKKERPSSSDDTSASAYSPVTARTRFSRNTTPYLHQHEQQYQQQQQFQQPTAGQSSRESSGSVIHRSPDDEDAEEDEEQEGETSSLIRTRRSDEDEDHPRDVDSSSLESFSTGAGSVVRHHLTASGDG